MAKCVECNGKVRPYDGDVTCTDCGDDLHNNCADWISGSAPFCSDCYSDIDWYEECPECENDTLAVYKTGSFCQYCEDNYGPGMGFM